MARKGNKRWDGSSLTAGEQLGISITEEDVEETRAIGANCMVGRLWAEKKVNKEAFKSILSRIWRAEGYVEFKEIQDNLWIFEFSDGGVKDRVMANRPWSFERQILVLKEFDGIVPPSKMEFTHSSCWIQIHEMPLLCMSRAVGTKIGESLGQLEEVDVANEGAGWGRSLRIHVTLDLTRPLERGRNLLYGGKSYWVEFQYEKLPLFCFHCGRILHGPKGCPVNTSRRINMAEGEKPWGVWLRADESRKKTGGGTVGGVGEGWGPEMEGGLSPEKADTSNSQNRETSMASSGFSGNPRSGSSPHMESHKDDTETVPNVPKKNDFDGKLNMRAKKGSNEARKARGNEIPTSTSQIAKFEGGNSYGALKGKDSGGVNQMVGAQGGPIETRRKVQVGQGPSKSLAGGPSHKGQTQPSCFEAGLLSDRNNYGPKRKREGITAMTLEGDISPGGSTRFWKRKARNSSSPTLRMYHADYNQGVELRREEENTREHGPTSMGLAEADEQPHQTP